MSTSHREQQRARAHAAPTQYRPHLSPASADHEERSHIAHICTEAPWRVRAIDDAVQRARLGDASEHLVGA